MPYSRRYVTTIIILSIILASTLVSVVGATYTTTQSTNGNGVIIIKGPSPIKNAESKSEEDLTLMNEYLAVTFGIGTSPPWGIPNGYIIDAAPVVNGTPGEDVLAQLSFLVNGWGKWAKLTDIQVVENTSSEGIIKTIGYWGDIKVEITYVLRAGDNYLYIETKLTNEGNKTYDLLSGYAISFKRGWAFTPGFGTGRHYAPTPKEELGVLDDWVAGYDESFAIGLWAPYYTHLSTSIGWVDPLTKYSIKPGETKVFKAYLIFEPIGDTCRILSTVLKLKNESYGVVKGSVKTVEGSIVEKPIIVVEENDKPYCWYVGSKGTYSIELPPGNYTLHAEAKNHGPSTAASISLKANETLTVDFNDVTLPGKVIINVYRNDTKEPLDAKILISGGQISIVKYLQVSTVYTDIENVGKAVIELPPGTYTLTIGHGEGFISKPVKLENVVVEPGSELKYNVSINILVEPEKFGWYAADLHVHSNILDGRTPPKYLVTAELAAGLDFAFVSDHDSVVNYKEMEYWASKRGIPFIPSVEISPRWGHFNPYPIKHPEYLVYRGTPCKIFEAARKAGAIVIRVNHPYRGGYFYSWEKGELPGPYCPDWDVAEINGKWDSSDNKTLMKLWEFWNKGQRYYLTAGSDVHDVWSTPYVGYPRVYAYIPTKPTPEALAYAEKYGHTFITYGPLVFMNPLPGKTIPVSVNDTSIKLKLDLWAVDGLSKIVIVSRGQKVYEKTFTETPIHTQLEVELPVNKILPPNTSISWVSVMAWDTDGDIAITNPIWVSKEVVQPTITKTITSTKTVTETETVTTTETVTEKTTETVTETTTTTTTATHTVTTTSITTYTLTKTTTTTSVVTTSIPTTVTSTITTTVTETNVALSIGLLIVGLIIGAIIGVVITRRR